MTSELMFTLFAALVVGGSLGLSGAVMQSVLRNPLAEPYLLGMVGGSTLFMVLALNLGLAVWGALVMPLASLLGSAFALALVAFIAWRAERSRRADGADPEVRAAHSTVVLAGWAVGGTLGSLDIVALAYATSANRDAVNCWLWGSLSTARPLTVALAAVVLALAVAVVTALRRELTVMELGHEEAACLGVRVRAVAGVVLAVAAVATSMSVALAGMVGFVGLVVPQVARRLFGPRPGRVILLSAVLGAIFVAAAELLGRQLPPTSDGSPIGVGVVCAVLGGPLFLGLLATKADKGA